MSGSNCGRVLVALFLMSDNAREANLQLVLGSRRATRKWQRAAGER